MEAHAPDSGGWVDRGLLLIFFFAARPWIFPTTEFNLTDPPHEKTRSAQVRKRVAIVLGTVATALLGIVLKRLFG